ncbi:MAG: HD domain-containing protein [Candidatus Omnitrophica bacterium]|nr:HD domain-containing protein [Candidatus Omnitrophota bacterium]
MFKENFNTNCSKENNIDNSQDINIKKRLEGLDETLKEYGCYEIFQDLQKEFPKAEIFLVGGAVRDTILDRDTKDYDFVVRNVDSKKLESFLNTKGQVNLVGQTFGVFKFNPKESKLSHPLDIALPRKDYALGTGGYRDVEIETYPSLDIESDLSRRDFTVNAMALKIDSDLEIVDPFNGMEDLKNNLIKAVRDPKDRFQEDYSRMLRAMRFVCQLNTLHEKSDKNWKIEEKTWQALKENMENINKIKSELHMKQEGNMSLPDVEEERVVPYEVIAKELLKSFKENPVQAMELYDKSGAFKEIMPEILKMKDCPQPDNYHHEGDVWEHTKIALQKLFSDEFKKEFDNETPSLELIIATLFHDIGKPYTIQTPKEDGTDRIRFNEHDRVGADKTREIAKRLKLSSPPEVGIDVSDICWLIKEHMILVRGDISKMRNSTIEKYFFNPDKPSKDLLKISFADVSATIPKSGNPNFREYNQMKKRIKELKEMSKDKKDLPERLINGHDIMKELDLKPGPKIGEILEKVREKQLQGDLKTKKQALDFIKKLD